MKKRESILLIILMLGLIIFPLISAQTFEFGEVKDQIAKVIDIVLGILSPIFETIIGDYESSEFFFSKVLLLILLIIITKNILDRTPLGEDNKKVGLIISLVISILAIRFMNENDFFGAILIHYGTLGIAITTIVPMVIFFYFIHGTKIGTFGRKVFWSIYGITMLAIWILKRGEIPMVANWIYGLTLVGVIIFIIIDKNIHAYLGLSDFKQFEKNTIKKRIRELKKELDDINEHFQKNRMSFPEYKQEKIRIEDLIKEFSKE